MAILPSDGCYLVHTTSGELLHKLIPSAELVHPHMTSIAINGHFVVHYADHSGHLAVFTCGGRQLCECSLGDPALVSMLFLPIRKYVLFPLLK